MPRTWNWQNRNYRLTCLTPGCGSHVETDGGPDTASREDRDHLTGALVSDTFRFLGEGRGNAARCRTCEAQRRATRRGRVPGMSGNIAGRERRFGVELEVILPSGTYQGNVAQRFRAEQMVGWDVRGDGSLSGYNGAEIVSPILAGEDGEEQIRKACRILRDMGATVNRACGMHAHHEIRDLSVEAIGAVASAWNAQADLIDGLVSESRREGNNTWCRRLSPSELSYIRNATSTSELSRWLRNRSYNARYRGFNLASYVRYGTVEIRQHQGTINAEKIITWVRFGQALIETAAREPQSLATRRNRMRDLLGAMGERLDETARTYLLGRAIEFGAVEV